MPVLDVPFSGAKPANIGRESHACQLIQDAGILGPNPGSETEQDRPLRVCVSTGGPRALR